jgi:hypothetical protein
MCNGPVALEDNPESDQQSDNDGMTAEELSLKEEEQYLRHKKSIRDIGI